MILSLKIAMKGIIVNLIIGVMTARMDNFVLVIVQNVWSTFIIQVMQKLMRQKGNMTVHTWRISICVSIHIDIHPKLYMHSNGCPLYRVERI